MNTSELLRVENLKTYFFTHEGIVKAVDNVCFTINRGETLGLVGESGCGKSVTALSIMRLIASPPGDIIGGKIILNNNNLLSLTEKEMRKVRGTQVSMIFQEPMTSLDPVFTIGDEIIETLCIHQSMDKKEAKTHAIEALKFVGIPDAEKRVDCYPHELSGGMRQRAMIAMALSCNPQLLIADEPTTALDVTIQAQILKLINELKEKLNTSVLLITHDMGVVAEMCDHVAIMYGGHIVEHSDIYTIFSNPMHPYTKGLSKSIPRMDLDVERLETIKGVVPNLLDLPPGCPFNSRCDFCMDVCFKEMPELIPVKKGHLVKCHLYGEK
jgi:peptide/nickel transport system ATP-binding protein/oligopeptide transport system ATP-binding protein